MGCRIRVVFQVEHFVHLLLYVQRLYPHENRAPAKTMRIGRLAWLHLASRFRGDGDPSTARTIRERMVPLRSGRQLVAVTMAVRVRMKFARGMSVAMSVDEVRAEQQGLVGQDF